MLLKHYKPVVFNNRIQYHNVVGNKGKVVLHSKAIKEKIKSKRKKKKRLVPVRNIIFEYNNDSVSSNSPEKSRDHQDYHPSVLDQNEEGLHVIVRNVKLVTGTTRTTTITTNNGKTPLIGCLLYTSPSPRDGLLSRMPSSA